MKRGHGASARQRQRHHRGGLDLPFLVWSDPPLPTRHSPPSPAHVHSGGASPDPGVVAAAFTTSSVVELSLGVGGLGDSSCPATSSALAASASSALSIHCATPSWAPVVATSATNGCRNRCGCRASSTPGSVSNVRTPHHDALGSRLSSSSLTWPVTAVGESRGTRGCGLFGRAEAPLREAYVSTAH